MNERAARLEDAIKKCLVPYLRQDAFTGSGRTFRRVIEGWIQVVNVQGSRFGGQFAINLGLQPLAIPDVLGNVADPKKITEPLCEFRRRLSESGADQWWKHDGSALSMEAAASAAADVYERIGRPLLNEICSAGSPLNTVSAEAFEKKDFDFRGFKSTNVRTALVLARLREAQGRLSESRSFAKYGLAHVGNAVALRRELERLCLTH